jgi:hypothetical protein
VLAEAGYRVPARELPNFVVRFASLFEPTLRHVVDDLGKPARMNGAKARDVLGWSGRPMRDMVLDTARAITERGGPAPRPS